MTAMTMLKHKLKERGRPNEPISLTAILMCELLDEYASLHGQHLKDIQDENRKLKERVFKLETKDDAG